MSDRVARLALGALDAWSSIRFRVSRHSPRRSRFERWPDESHILTTVIRLPTPIAEELARLAAAVARTDPSQFHYPAETMHVTVLNLDSVASGSIEGIEESVASAVSACEPPTLHVAGLGLSGATVYAKVFGGPGLRRLRDGVARAGGLRRSLLHRPLEGVAFANVLRFTDAVDQGLIRDVRAETEREVGTFTPPALELVMTDKVLSTRNTHVLGRFPL